MPPEIKRLLDLHAAAVKSARDYNLQQFSDDDSSAVTTIRLEAHERMREFRYALIHVLLGYHEDYVIGEIMNYTPDWKN
jgi:hypothetical protein